MSVTDDKAKPRVRLHAQKRTKQKRALRIIVTTPGVIDLREGSYKGHPADLIEAPEGTKIERPKESDDATAK